MRIIVPSCPLGFCYSSGLHSVTRTDQMLGSNVATDTLPLRTQMRILPALRLVNIVHCFRNNNKSHSSSHLHHVRYDAHIETNSSLQEPIRQE